MNIKTSNGLGIKTGQNKLKASNRMGIKTSNGMGLETSSNGTGLADNSFMKFNEYKRKRQYFFGDRGKGNNDKKKPAPKPEVKKPEPKKEVKVKEPPKEKTPEPVKEEPEPPPLIPPLIIPDTPRETQELATVRLPPALEAPPKIHGNSVGSMQRMLKLFN